MKFLFQWLKFMKNLNKQKKLNSSVGSLNFDQGRDHFSHNYLTMHSQFTLKPLACSHEDTHLEYTRFATGMFSYNRSVSCCNGDGTSSKISSPAASAPAPALANSKQWGQTNNTINVKLIHCTTPQQGKMCSENMQTG